MNNLLLLLAGFSFGFGIGWSARGLFKAVWELDWSGRWAAAWMAERCAKDLDEYLNDTFGPDCPKTAVDRIRHLADQIKGERT